ncbi:MAG: cytochrome c [Pyrinomonadaceae bacterium]|nr:cytochrome c [Pyrinomonadaceae bacterium]
MKRALLSFALSLTMMVGFVASTTSSMEAQNSSPSTGSSTPGAIYGRSCASCHGRDGRANTAKGKLRGARNLTDPQWQAEVSDERIFNSITNGRGKMPSYAKKITEAETNSLVSYVRALKK